MRISLFVVEIVTSDSLTQPSLPLGWMGSLTWCHATPSTSVRSMDSIVSVEP